MNTFRVVCAAIALAVAATVPAFADEPDALHAGMPPELDQLNWALYAARVPQPRPRALKHRIATTMPKSKRPGGMPFWYTFHASPGRDAWDANESVLTTANVNQNQFGMRYSVPVDGEVYAEPLYVPQVNVAGQGVHDVLLIATEGDSLYAFDAESGATLWKTTYVNPPAVTTFSTSRCKCSSIAFQQGITGTPVVDSSTLIAYFVTKTSETSPTGVFSNHYRLHAASLATGVDVAPPTDIKASIVATDGTSVLLDPAWSLQRPGLALSRGVVYVSFGSGGDRRPATTSGWVIGFDKTTLAQILTFSTETGLPQLQHLWYGENDETRLGAIWMSGAAPAVDAAGNIYVFTGNGAFDGKLDWGQSVLKLAPDLSHVVDYFTPSQWAKQSNSDGDLSSAGPLILPETVAGKHVIVAGGKSGVTYLLEQSQLGHFHANQDNVLSEKMTNKGLWGTPAAYVGPDGLQYVIVPGGGPMTLWQVTSKPISLAFMNQTSESFGDGDDSGSEPVISSNGTTPGSAIVWAYSRSGSHGPATLTLRAFDATNLTKELVELPYTNWMGGGELQSPTVANGMVFTAGESTVSAYGLL